MDQDRVIYANRRILVGWADWRDWVGLFEDEEGLCNFLSSRIDQILVLVSQHYQRLSCECLLLRTCGVCRKILEILAAFSTYIHRLMGHDLSREPEQLYHHCLGIQTSTNARLPMEEASVSDRQHCITSFVWRPHETEG